MPATRTIRHRGPAPVVGALRQVLTEEGVEVTYESPEVEERSTQAVVEFVSLYVLVKATGKVTDAAFDAAIKAAVAKFRERFGRTTGATVEADDEDR